MYVIIEIYIIISIMLLLFNLVFILTKNSRIQRLNPQKDKLKNMLVVEFESYTPQDGLSKKAIDFLTKELKTTQALMVLETEMKKRRIYREELKAEIMPYVFNNIDSFRGKAKNEKAYYAYVLSCFDYQESPSIEVDYSALLSFLDTNYLYVFTNTMDVIYQLGDPYILLAAIRKIDERSGFYHSKLLTDGLLTFTGDLEILKSLIIKEFNSYTTLTQVSLLNYFRFKNLEVDDFCLTIIKERKLNEEVIYAAMRYFAKNSNQEAKNIFIDLLNRGKSFWVEELLAIQALEHYDDRITRAAIKQKVTSKNWEVRSNAISYLYKGGLVLDEVKDILALEDRYASEKLFYYYEEDEKIAPYIQESLIALERKNERIEMNSEAIREYREIEYD
ncbi:hypothetical protein ACTQ5X_06995 [Jeotgalibaca porci]|uniref:hypothetical protein n=1 Tax=Jeotgalibaca porci TaxID=1868793 RepID=UPI003F8DA5FC